MASTVLTGLLLGAAAPCLTGCEGLGDALGTSLVHAGLVQLDGLWTDDIGATVRMGHVADLVTVQRTDTTGEANIPPNEAVWNEGAGKILSTTDPVRISLVVYRNHEASPEIVGTLVQDPATGLYTTIQWDSGPVWKKKN